MAELPYIGREFGGGEEMSMGEEAYQDYLVSQAGMEDEEPSDEELLAIEIERGVRCLIASDQKTISDKANYRLVVDIEAPFIDEPDRRTMDFDATSDAHAINKAKYIMRTNIKSPFSYDNLEVYRLENRQSNVLIGITDDLVERITNHIPLDSDDEAILGNVLYQFFTGCIDVVKPAIELETETMIYPEG